jgi:carbonic anhydrase
MSLVKTFLFISILCINSALGNDPHHEPAPAAPTAPVHEKPTTVHAEETKKENHDQHTTTQHSEHKREKGPVKPEQSLTWLKNGNKRYTLGRVRWDGATHSDRARLSKGQKPHAIVVSCSDSRVPPELVFDQKLGEVFTIRTAGQALDFGAIASIEYAVSHLGSNLIVIMGHESCGAVKAALGTLKGGDAGSIWLNQLVKDLHPRLKRFTDLTPTDNVIPESWANVEGTATDLISKSEVIKSLIESGDVKIEKALYHLSSGSVEWR